MTTPDGFWKDLEDDLMYPEFYNAYVVSCLEVNAYDELMNKEYDCE